MNIYRKLIYIVEETLLNTADILVYCVDKAETAACFLWNKKALTFLSVIGIIVVTLLIGVI